MEILTSKLNYTLEQKNFIPLFHKKTIHYTPLDRRFFIFLVCLVDLQNIFLSYVFSVLFGNFPKRKL